MKLDELDILILDAMCLDLQLKEIYTSIGIPKSTMTMRLGNLKELFKVKTNTGLIFKYTILCNQNF
jgi:hypothetical protein